MPASMSLESFQRVVRNEVKKLKNELKDRFFIDLKYKFSTDNKFYIDGLGYFYYVNDCYVGPYLSFRYDDYNKRSGGVSNIQKFYEYNKDELPFLKYKLDNELKESTVKQKRLKI